MPGRPCVPARYTTSGAQMPFASPTQAGFVGKASSTYVQCVRSVDRYVGTPCCTSDPSGFCSVAVRASVVQ